MKKALRTFGETPKLRRCRFINSNQIRGARSVSPGARLTSAAAKKPRVTIKSTAIPRSCWMPKNALTKATITSRVANIALIDAYKIALFKRTDRCFRRGRSAFRRALSGSASPFRLCDLSTTRFILKIRSEMNAARAPSESGSSATGRRLLPLTGYLGRCLDGAPKRQRPLPAPPCRRERQAPRWRARSPPQSH